MDYRFSTALMIVTTIPLLTHCDRDDGLASCGSTKIAFTLPEPGDVLELTSFVCGDLDASNEIWIRVGGQVPQPDVELRVEGNAFIDVQWDGYAEVAGTPALCDEGLRITLVHTGQNGAVISVLSVRGTDGDGSVHCDFRWEMP